MLLCGFHHTSRCSAKKDASKKRKETADFFSLSGCRGTARPRQMTPRRDVLGRMRPWHRPLRWSCRRPMADSWRAQKPTSSAEPLGQFPPEWMAAGLDVDSWTAIICAVLFSDKMFVCQDDLSRLESASGPSRTPRFSGKYSVVCPQSLMTLGWNTTCG